MAKIQRTPQTTPDARIRSGPAARLLASRHRLDLACVRGTGPGGYVTKHDVMIALAAAGTGASAGAGAGAGFRAREGAAMTAGTRVCVSADCRADRLVALLAQLNVRRSLPISLNDLILRAVSKALLEIPAVNAAWSPQGSVPADQVDLAISVLTADGILTPVIRNAAGMSLLALSAEVRTMVARAHAGRLDAAELQGGSFSVSHLEIPGVEEIAALVNAPQAGALAVGAVRGQAVSGSAQPSTAGRWVRCILSVDPRVIDSALAASWLATFQRLIESPVALLV